MLAQITLVAPISTSEGGVQCRRASLWAIAATLLVFGPGMRQPLDQKSQVVQTKRPAGNNQADGKHTVKLKPGQEVKITGRILKPNDEVISDKEIIELGGEISWKGINPPAYLTIIIWDREHGNRISAAATFGKLVIKDPKSGGNWTGKLKAHWVGIDEYYVEVRPLWLLPDRVEYTDKQDKRISWTKRLTIKPRRTPSNRGGEIRP